MVLFNNYVLNSLQTISAKLGHSEEISRRLIWLYIGLTALSLRSIIYALACPTVVKQYRSSTDYIRGEFSVMPFSERTRIEAMLDGSDDKTVPDKLTQLRERLELANAEERLVVITSSDRHVGASRSYATALNYFNGLLDIYFNLENKSRPRSRRAAGLLYIVGFIVLGALGLVNFVKVVSLLWV